MAYRVAALSTAHVHAPSFVDSFVRHPEAKVVGVWDDVAERGEKFSAERGLAYFADYNSLLAGSDLAVICSENLKHAELVEACAEHGVSVLCEKPIAGSADQLARIEAAVAKSKITVMTAFPCPFAPAFEALLSRKESLGEVLGMATTNQGSCPFGWFVEPELSGGGAMIDHVVHVTDLMRRILGSEPAWVQAMISNQMYQQTWEDTAFVTVGFANGTFATIDSSWSKKNYKTWGNVALRIVGSKAKAEIDLFAQGPDLYVEKHHHLGIGADYDALMVGEFLTAISEKREPRCSLKDGIAASKVALAAYESVKQKGEVVAVK